MAWSVSSMPTSGRLRAYPSHRIPTHLLLHPSLSRSRPPGRHIVWDSGGSPSSRSQLRRLVFHRWFCPRINHLGGPLRIRGQRRPRRPRRRTRREERGGGGSPSGAATPASRAASFASIAAGQAWLTVEPVWPAAAGLAEGGNSTVVPVWPAVRGPRSVPRPTYSRDQPIVCRSRE